MGPPAFENSDYIYMMAWAALAGHGGPQHRAWMVPGALGGGCVTRGGLGDVPRVPPCARECRSVSQLTEIHDVPLAYVESGKKKYSFI